MTAVVLRADARSLPLPDASVDLVVTSPPYWKLRDYRDGGKSLDGQIGNEATPGEYIANLLTCTREWMRVLKPGGSIFVVLGDKYAQPGKARQANVSATGIGYDGYPGKSLLFLPERYRIGCVTELGLIARAKIAWFKTNHMPESVDDRVCMAHEDIVHLVKQPRYFADVDEIRERYTDNRQCTGTRDKIYADGLDRRGRTPYSSGPTGYPKNPLGKSPGSVWEIPTVPLLVPDRIAHARCCAGWKREGCEDALDHFAAYPPELCRRIILGWSPPGGVVVDPFGGTGTTALVADVLGRTGYSFDMSADYCRLAQWRTTDPGERARALGVPKAPPVPENQGSLFDGLAEAS